VSINACYHSNGKNRLDSIGTWTPEYREEKENIAMGMQLSLSGYSSIGYQLSAFTDDNSAR